MAFDYASLQATVDGLMAKFGSPNCRVVRPSTSVADPSKPWKGVDAPDEVIVASCSVLLGGLSRLRMGGPAQNRGTGLSPADHEDSTAFMPAAAGALAQVGDYIEVPAGSGYDRLAIERLSPLTPGNVDLLWQVTVKAV